MVTASYVSEIVYPRRWPLHNFILLHATGLQLPRVRQAGRVRVQAAAELYAARRGVCAPQLPHQCGIPMPIQAVPERIRH